MDDFNEHVIIKNNTDLTDASEIYEVTGAKPGFLYFVTGFKRIMDIQQITYKKTVYTIGFETQNHSIIDIFGNHLADINESNIIIDNMEKIVLFDEGLVLLNENQTITKKVLFNGSIFSTDDGKKYSMDRVIFLQLIKKPTYDIFENIPVYLSKLLKQYNEKYFDDRLDAEFLTNLEIKMKTLHSEYVEEFAIEKQKHINQLTLFKDISSVVRSLYIKTEKQTIEILPGNFSYLLYDDSFLYEMGFNEDVIIRKFPKNVFYMKVTPCIIKLFFGSLYNSKFPTIHEILNCDQFDIFLTVKTLHLLAVYFGIKIYDLYYRDLLPRFTN